MRRRSFSGKVAAITGAASGIGRSLAFELARRGCHLALSDLDEDGLARVAAEIRGVPVTIRKLDVTLAEALRDWASDVIRDHGRVNLLFNNAGIGYKASVRGVPLAEFERVMAVNFWAVVRGTQAFLPYLESSGDGHVINTSSLFGLIGFPGQSAYVSSKFAVRGFTETLSTELAMTGSCVRATCVHPGGIKTNIARAAKVHASVNELGLDVETAGLDFERKLRGSPDAAARAILNAVSRNRRRVLVGGDARVVDWLQRLFPGSYPGMFAHWGKRLVLGSGGKHAQKAEP